MTRSVSDYTAISTTSLIVRLRSSCQSNDAGEGIFMRSLCWHLIIQNGSDVDVRLYRMLPEPSGKLQKLTKETTLRAFYIGEETYSFWSVYASAYKDL